MGILDKVFGNISDYVSTRDKICADADKMMESIQNDLDAISDFISSDWIKHTNGVINDMLEMMNEVLVKSYIPAIKLGLKKSELEKFNKDLKEKIYIHNERVAVKLVKSARAIIGDVEGRELDDQQMRCIVKPMSNHLVIAGAGTGKTTTIVGKIKYLLNTRRYGPSDILVLSFTNASAEEMSTRIYNETHEQIAASTFHKLGLNIITKVNGITPKITKIQLQKFVKDQLVEYLKESNYLDLLCRYLISNYKYEKSEFDFQTQKEYEEYLRMNPPVTLKGEHVKSYGEVDIANFLFINGIDYEYEKEYEIDTRTEERFQYYPDFYLKQAGIYIEYWGIDENGNVPSYFTSTNGQDPSKEYNDGIVWKRNIHRANGTKLVEVCSYERKQGTLLSNLESILKDNQVIFMPRSSEKIWEEVSKNNSKNVLTGVSELFSTIISLIKSNNYSFEEFAEKCGSISGRNEVVIKLVEPIYKVYQDTLNKLGEIDFTDMINQATAYVSSGKYINEYKYVIVDEYQDISKARYNLLKSLRDSSNYDLFCVGDDWQSIYRFAGSDMDYIINFSKYWGPTEYSKIETTYRFSDSLIDISGNFVMKNPNQIQKKIRGVPSSVGFALGEIKGYTEELAIQFMLSRLDELPKNSTVFFIGRYVFDSNLLNDCHSFDCKYDPVTTEAKVIYKSRPDLKMQFITAHKSKGLQADYVFIINNKDRGMGFPSKIQDDPVVDMLLEVKEDYPYAEERRLFYVALTRAKMKAFIVVVDNNKSEFVKELEYNYTSQMKRADYICPLCGGSLERRKGQYGNFYGCSNYRVNNCRFTRKIK